MDNGDKQAFALAMGELQMVTQGELSREKLAAYFHRLSPYTIEQVQAVCARLGNQPGRVFFPAIGEFMEALQGSHKGNAKAAWLEISALAGKYGPSGEYHGRDNPPKTDDPAARRAIAACWFDMCTQPPSEQQWVQKRFEEAYETTADVMQREAIGHEGNVLSYSDLKRLAGERFQ